MFNKNDASQNLDMKKAIEARHLNPFINGLTRSLRALYAVCALLLVAMGCRYVVDRAHLQLSNEEYVIISPMPESSSYLQELASRNPRVTLAQWGSEYSKAVLLTAHYTGTQRFVVVTVPALGQPIPNGSPERVRTLLSEINHQATVLKTPWALVLGSVGLALVFLSRTQSSAVLYLALPTVALASAFKLYYSCPTCPSLILLWSRGNRLTPARS